MQPIEEWIRTNLDVEWTNSATLRYAAMDHQAPPDLGGVYRDYTPERVDDWIDLTLIMAYLAALGTTGRILDVGTGDGWPALPLAPYVDRVVGIDATSKRINTAEANRARRGHENVEFRHAACEQIPFPTHSFDGAVAGTAIEQAVDPGACLREIYRVLKRGGALVATVEHLAGELGGRPEQQVELFQRGDRFWYRYAVKEPAPPREVEYLVEINPDPQLEATAAAFPHRSGFTRRKGEPGMQPLTSAIAAACGLPLLEQVRDKIVRTRGFELHHYTVASLRQALTAAGFSRVQIRGPITRIASRCFIGLHESGTLPRLRPWFAHICRGLAEAWAEVPAEESSLLFIRARKET